MNMTLDWAREQLEVQAQWHSARLSSPRSSLSTDRQRLIGSSVNLGWRRFLVSNLAPVSTGVWRFEKQRGLRGYPVSRYNKTPRSEK